MKLLLFIWLHFQKQKVFKGETFEVLWAAKSYSYGYIEACRSIRKSLTSKDSATLSRYTKRNYIHANYIHAGNLNNICLFCLEFT